MIDFWYGLWISFALIASASFFVFFTKRLNILIMASAIGLSAVSLQFLTVDAFRGSWTGKAIVAALWFLFLIQSQAVRGAQTIKPPKTPVLLGLPFLAFIAIAVSLDLLTLLMGLVLFNVAFWGLSVFKGGKISFDTVQKSFVAFLSFAYGMAVLFSREGTIALSDLRLKLVKGNWDNWTVLGVGLLVIGVMIEFYAIIPLLGKKKK